MVSALRGTIICHIVGDRMEFRKSDKEQYERRTYYVKMDILEESDNCTGSKDYEQCMKNNDYINFDYKSATGCLPGWLIQRKLSFSKDTSIRELDYCKATVENISQDTQQALLNDFRDYLNFRQTHRNVCLEPCKHTFFTSTLATKISNRKALYNSKR
jgi:hypothetical protein